MFLLETFSSFIFYYPLGLKIIYAKIGKTLFSILMESRVTCVTDTLKLFLSKI